MHRNLIERDLEKVTNSLQKILLGRPNEEVYDDDYIRPSTIRQEPLLLSSGKGEFMYYLKIRDALKLALDTGRIPKDLAPPRAPCYIEELVEGE